MRILTLLVAFAVALHPTAANQKNTAIMGYQWAQDKFQDLMQEHGAPQPLARKQLLVTPRAGDIKMFWTMNVANNQPTEIQATLQHIGKHCYIYLELEQENRVSKETIQNLADQFDNQIYDTNHKFFGSEASPGIDFDKRITLLLLDIQDGWEPGRGYVAGYFSPLDTYSTELWQFSNEREMFYLDVFPGDPKRPDYLGVLAHEFQHMIHHNYDKREKLWLNEAMSQIAFYVNNYGHAPQILAFIQQPDTQLDEFNNGLDDYGNVYLFMYYLLSKKLGDMETVAKVFSEIVQSQKQSIESMDEVLAANGFDFTIDEIVPDFLVANYVNDWNLANGEYGYNRTLPMQVQPTSVYAFDALPDAMEGKVNQRGADFIRMTPRIASEPVNPTLVDKIKIFAEFPGMVSWNINEGQLPPQAFIPNQAEVDGQYIKMPTTTDEQGRHFVEVGPFRGAGVRVTKVNYTLKSKIAELSGMIPVYSFQTLGMTAVDSVTINFNGQNKGWIGKDKRFLLKKYLRYADGKKVVSDVELDSKNDASWTENLNGVEEFTLIPISTLGGELKYNVEFETAKSASLSLLDEWASSEELFMKKLMQYPDLLDTLQKEFLNLEEGTRNKLAPQFRQFLRGYQFRLFNSVNSPELMEQFSVDMGSKTIQADDKDDAHDNIDYLVSKAKEGTHNLSHLQIDPKVIEGQILKIWKLLEIARGFPHLPLPDGFAIKDYDVSELENVLDGWQQSGDDKYKEPLRRMALAQTVILSTYNEGLVMAEDTAMSILDLVRFFFSARETASSLLKPVIAKGGIIGTLGDRVLKKIQAKIIQILNKVVSLVSVKLRPPYNTIVPIATSVITGIYANVKDINVEYDHEDTLKLFAVKTAGKYALMSFPRIGLVDVGQKNVGHLANQARKLETSYDVNVAQDAVREKLAPILEEINSVHAHTLKKREYVQIAKWVTQLAGLTSAIDPTNISKVVAILSTATGTGLLGHSIYKSTKTLYGIPGKVPAGIDAAFTPYNEVSVAPETYGDTSQVHNIVILQERTERAHQNFVNQLVSFEGGIGLNNQNHLEVLEKYMRNEETYEAILTDQEMAILATQDGSDEMILEMGENSLLRSELEVQLLLNNQAEVRRLASEIKGREEKLMRKLRNLPSRVRGKSIVAVREVSRVISGNDFSVKVNIRSMGKLNDVKLKIFGEGVQLEEDGYDINTNTRFLTIKGKKVVDRMTTLHLILETKSGVASYPTILNL